jgi:hypothetical protein
MTAPNAELAYRVLDHIDAHPEQWRQERWLHKTSCGTVACFAGWAVVLAGGGVQIDSGGNWLNVTLDDETFDRFSEAGCAALGIEDDEVPGVDPICDCGCTDAPGLFDGTNSRDDLGRYVEAIFGPRPTVTA